MIVLDHLAVAGETLVAATSHCETVLQTQMQQGGEHDVFFTHNTLLGLDEGLYLEAISVNPLAQKPDRPRWFDLDRFRGAARLTNWICRTDDLDAVLADLPSGYGKPVSLKRGELRWRMAVPETGVLPFDNCAPALIQWECDLHPAQMLKPSSIKLQELTVSHPEALLLQETIEPLLNDSRVIFETGQPGLSASLLLHTGSAEL